MIEEAVKLNLPFHKAHSVIMGDIKYWYFPDSVRGQIKENMLCYIARREDNKVIGEAIVATIIEGTPQEVFSQTALYTELSAPMFLSIFGNYQTVSAVGFADVKPYREEVYVEDSVGIYTEQNDKRAYIWRSDDERLVRIVWERATDYLKEHSDGVTVPDSLALPLDTIVLVSMEELYDTCTEDDT